MYPGEHFWWGGWWMFPLAMPIIMLVVLVTVLYRLFGCGGLDRPGGIDILTEIRNQPWIF